MENSFLSIVKINKSFGGFNALSDIDLNISKGEFVSILGPSGCGKTTLLRIIAGLESHDSGQVYLETKDISYLTPSKRQFGIVFQSYALFPNLSVYQNVAYGLKKSNFTSKQHYIDKIMEVIDLVDIKKHLHKYPSQLSGGQQQRVALARALALSPKLLLLDEPLSALDAKVRDYMRVQIRSLQLKLKITVVMVTHDQIEALTMSDKIAVMNHGIIDQYDTPINIYHNPKNQYIADFIGNMNFITNLPDSAIKILAVRPEDIKINTLKGNEPAKLINTEFRGSYYRLHFLLEKYKQTVISDISNQEYIASKIKHGQSVNLEFTHFSEY